LLRTPFPLPQCSAEAIRVLVIAEISTRLIPNGSPNSTVPAAEQMKTDTATINVAISGVTQPPGISAHDHISVGKEGHASPKGPKQI
jgi:hypothetical protein